jgi:hypothetical protein
LPPEVAAVSLQVSQATDQVNLGLQLIRQGWSQFTTACASGDLQAQASIGLNVTKAAGDAFTVARGLLNAARSGG